MSSFLLSMDAYDVKADDLYPVMLLTMVTHKHNYDWPNLYTNSTYFMYFKTNVPKTNCSTGLEIYTFPASDLGCRGTTRLFETANSLGELLMVDICLTYSIFRRVCLYVCLRIRFRLDAVLLNFPKVRTCINFKLSWFYLPIILCIFLAECFKSTPLVVKSGLDRNSKQRNALSCSFILILCIGFIPTGDIQINDLNRYITISRKIT